MGILDFGDFGDFGFWILGILDFGDFGDFGFWILGILDFGFWGVWILDFGAGIPNPKSKIQNPQNPKSPKSKIQAKIPKIRPKKLGFWILGILDFGFWILGILDFGFLGFWGFWILGILDFGFWGFWILDFGFWGFWILDFWDFGDFGFWIFGTLCSRSLCAKFGFWNLGILDFGFWNLGILDFGDFGFWILGILDFGFWGSWILDFGLGILDGHLVTKFWMLHKKRRLCTPNRVGGLPSLSVVMFCFKSILSCFDFSEKCEIRPCRNVPFKVIKYFWDYFDPKRLKDEAHAAQQGPLGSFFGYVAEEVGI